MKLFENILKNYQKSKFSKKSKIFLNLCLLLITFLSLKSAETHPGARKCYGKQKGTPKTTLCVNPYFLGSQLREKSHVLNMTLYRHVGSGTEVGGLFGIS